jgi:hypothetical protein
MKEFEQFLLEKDWSMATKNTRKRREQLVKPRRSVVSSKLAPYCAALSLRDGAQRDEIPLLPD